MSETIETKEFPTLVVGSCLTGIGLCHSSYADMQECASWLYGQSLWTHELVHPEIQKAFKAEGYRQFPKIPCSEEALETDWREVARIVETYYGETVQVARGSTERSKGPIETLTDLRRDKPIIVVVASEKGE